ncbi:MAG: sugar phosphate isomerase/epimerase family protein [Armatimonadota bacterium]
MKCGVAVWNWLEPSRTLIGLMEELVSEGFEAISVQPRQVLGLDDGELAEMIALLDENEMPVTVHAAADQFTEELMRGLLDRLGPRLRAVTLDGVMRSAPSGKRWDAALMVETLLMVERLGATTGARYGIEDFPIDGAAMSDFADELRPLRRNERWGMLLDIGHLNLRRNDAEYFGRMSVAENIERLPVPVIEVHVHDNPGDRDMHMPLGSGTLDYEEAAAALRARGFDGISTIEVCPSLHGRRPAEVWGTRAESLERWRRAWRDADEQERDRRRPHSRQER